MGPQAKRLGGLKEKTAVVHAGLEALGGSEKGLGAVRRRRTRKAS